MTRCRRGDQSRNLANTQLAMTMGRDTVPDVTRRQATHERQSRRDLLRRGSCISVAPEQGGGMVRLLLVWLVTISAAACAPHVVRSTKAPPPALQMKLAA